MNTSTQTRTPYLSCAETAKLVRAALKNAFPGVKFSVTSKTYSGGASINVGWIDGPSEPEVETVSKRFSGATFDGMQDLKSYHTSTHPVTGETVRYGADFVFSQRDYSRAMTERIAVQIAAHFNVSPVPALNEHNWYDSEAAETRMYDRYSFGDLVRQARHWTNHEGKLYQPEGSRIHTAPRWLELLHEPQVIESAPDVDRAALTGELVGQLAAVRFSARKVDAAAIKRIIAHLGGKLPPGGKPTCAICGAEAREGATFRDKPVCGACEGRMIDFNQRREARAERFERRADKLSAEAASTLETTRRFWRDLQGEPVHNYRDRARREKMFKREGVAFRKLDAAEKLSYRAERAAKNRAISSDDPAAVLKLRDKIAKAEANQAEYKRVNEAIRKLIKPQKTLRIDQAGMSMQQRNDAFVLERAARTAEQSRYPQYAPQLAAILGYREETALNLLTPDDLGRVGIPAYVLSNNNANIRRMKERLTELDKRNAQIAAAPAPQPETVNGVRVVRDLDDNRLRLYFPGKPAANVIAALKSNGFRWSPSNKAWQRQLNSAAEHAAGRVLALLS